MNDESVIKVEIGMFESEEVDASQYLRTSALATCIGIGVVDLDAHRGYLVHCAGAAASDSAEEFFNRIRDCSQNVKILVAGGDMCDDESNDESVRTEVGKDRVYILNTLRDMFPDVEPELFWSPPTASCWIEVYPGKGYIASGLD